MMSKRHYFLQCWSRGSHSSHCFRWWCSWCWNKHSIFSRCKSLSLWFMMVNCEEIIGTYSTSCCWSERLRGFVVVVGSGMALADGWLVYMVIGKAELGRVWLDVSWIVFKFQRMIVYFTLGIETFLYLSRWKIIDTFVEKRSTSLLICFVLLR